MLSNWFVLRSIPPQEHKNHVLFVREWGGLIWNTHFGCLTGTAFRLKNRKPTHGLTLSAGLPLVLIPKLGWKSKQEPEYTNHMFFGIFWLVSFQMDWRETAHD